MTIKDKYLEIKRFFTEYMLIRKLEKFGIKNYTINNDYSINVNGNVDLSYWRLPEIPFNFREVTGNFNMRFNKLTTLKGCPHTVGGEFDIVGNKLETLEYGPKSVGKNYLCGENPFNTLRSPLKSLGGEFYVLNKSDKYKLEEFKDYYNSIDHSDLFLNLEIIKRVYSLIDLNEKLEKKLPIKSNIKKIKL